MNSKKVTIGLVFFLFFITVAGSAIADDTYDYKSRCPKSANQADKWSFMTCNCTSYAADKMNEGGVGLNNTYKQTPKKKWGDAKNWIIAAKAAGISYNTSPQKRDIAWFDYGTYGHVAYVESVDSNKNVTLSEYNYSPAYGHIYGTRTVKKGSSAYPKYFIHFGAK